MLVYQLSVTVKVRGTVDISNLMKMYVKTKLLTLARNLAQDYEPAISICIMYHTFFLQGAITMTKTK